MNPTILSRLPQRIQDSPAALQRLEAAGPLLAAAMVGDWFWAPRTDGQLGNVRTISAEDLRQLRIDVFRSKGGIDVSLISGVK
jgi:hypothetical protein